MCEGQDVVQAGVHGRDPRARFLHHSRVDHATGPLHHDFPHPLANGRRDGRSRKALFLSTACKPQLMAFQFSRRRPHHVPQLVCAEGLRWSAALASFGSSVVVHNKHAGRDGLNLPAAVADQHRLGQEGEGLEAVYVRLAGTPGSGVCDYHVGCAADDEGFRQKL